MVREIQRASEKARTDFACRFTDLAIEFYRLFDDKNAQRRVLAL
jgi:hypothetical protein